MAPEPNRSVKFRAALKREIPILTAHGILTEEGADRLKSIYGLDHLREESSRLLTAVIFTIGSLLVGGGAISFVAAHWDEISRGPKLVLLFAALLAFHIAGYHLRYRANSPRLGHALIFCGCLVFGANIGLLAQIYQVSGSWYEMFGLWALGTLAMAWAARSWIIGMLVIATSFTWFSGFVTDHHEQLATIYPLLLLGALLPLAWAIRSRTLYATTFLGFIGAELVLAFAQLRADRYSFIAAAAGGLAAWMVGEFHRASGIRSEFANPVTGLGLAMLAVSAYFWSFHEVWSSHNQAGPNRFHWLIPAGCALVIGAALIARVWPRMAGLQRRYLLCGALAFALMCLAIVFNRFGEVLPTVVMNLVALILAGICIGKGIIEERRRAFWAGSLFTTLLVISRFFEYDTSLLLKSAVFIVCGIAAILAGLGYERSLRRREVY